MAVAPVDDRVHGKNRDSDKVLSDPPSELSAPTGSGVWGLGILPGGTQAQSPTYNGREPEGQKPAIDVSVLSVSFLTGDMLSAFFYIISSSHRDLGWRDVICFCFVGFALSIVTSVSLDWIYCLMGGGADDILHSLFFFTSLVFHSN